MMVKIMDYKIDEKVDGLHIDASVAPKTQQKLMEEMARCAAGTCSCPSTQYEKLEKIEVVPGQNGGSINLKAKSGEIIDRADIEKCLEHTAKIVKSSSPP